MAATEIERLVVRLVGDGKDYQKTLQQGARATDQYARHVDGKLRDIRGKFVREFKQIDTSVALTATKLLRGAEIMRTVETAAERYGREVKELNNLLRVGAISQETFNRALARSKAELRTASMNIEKVGQKLTALGGSMRSAGMAWSMMVTAPIVLGTGLSIREFLKFDQAMTETFAKMGRQAPKVRTAMEQLTFAIAKSGKVAFNPTELAAGYEELASAGLDATRSMAALPQVSKFAQAGAFGLDVAVKQLIGSMASFGKSPMKLSAAEFSSELEHFSDVIVSVANETTTGVEQVARAMSADAAMAAKHYGMELETLGAILGVYAMQNKDAEEAGNLTGRALRLMTSSAVKNSKEWEELGVNIINEATGEFMHFADAIEALEKNLEGLTGPQRVARLEMLGFEALAQKSIMPLIGMSDELRRQEKLYHRFGVTNRMAGIQMESFSNQLKVAWNHVRVAAIELGRSLGPALISVSKWLATAANWFVSLSEGTRVTIAVVALLVAAIGPLLVILGTMIAVSGAAATAYATLTTAIGASAAKAVIAKAAYLGLSTALAGITVLGVAAVFTGIAIALANAKREANEAREAFSRMSDDRLQAIQHMKGDDRTSALNKEIENRIKQWSVAKKEVEDLVQELSDENVFVKDYRNLLKSVGIDTGGLAEVEAQEKMMADRLKAAQDMAKQIAAAGEPAAKAAQNADGAATAFDEEAVDKLTEKLKEELATFGMTTRQADIYKLSINEASKAALEHANRIDAELTALEKKKEANEKATEVAKQLQQNADDFVKKMQEQAATMDMTAGAAEVYRMKLDGLSGAALKAAEAAGAQFDAATKNKEMMDKGKEITKAAMTPLQQFAEKQKELQELFDNGAISAETMQSALELARKEMDKDMHIKFKVDGVDAVEAGSAEAIARVQQFLDARNAAAQGKSIPSAIAKAAPKITTPVLQNLPDEFKRTIAQGGTHPNPTGIKPYRKPQASEMIPDEFVRTPAQGGTGARTWDEIKTGINRLVDLAEAEAKKGVTKVRAANLQGGNS